MTLNDLRKQIENMEVFNMKSPSRSFKGFKLSKNLKGSMKQASYILVPAIIAELVSNNLISAVVAGVLGKVVFSALEYYFKEY